MEFKTTLALQSTGQLRGEKLSWQIKKDLILASYQTPYSSPTIWTDALNISGQSSSNFTPLWSLLPAPAGGDLPSMLHYIEKDKLQ